MTTPVPNSAASSTTPSTVAVHSSIEKELEDLRALVQQLGSKLDEARRVIEKAGLDSSCLRDRSSAQEVSAEEFTRMTLEKRISTIAAKAGGFGPKSGVQIGCRNLSYKVQASKPGGKKSTLLCHNNKHVKIYFNKNAGRSSLLRLLKLDTT